MHNHKDNQGHDSKMMWLMMLPCLLLPIVFVVISGKGLGAIFGNWQWISSIVLMIGIHALMMKFMHNSNEATGIKKEENEEKNWFNL